MWAERIGENEHASARALADAVVLIAHVIDATPLPLDEEKVLEVKQRDWTGRCAAARGKPCRKATARAARSFTAVLSASARRPASSAAAVAQVRRLLAFAECRPAALRSAASITSSGSRSESRINASGRNVSGATRWNVARCRQVVEPASRIGGLLRRRDTGFPKAEGQAKGRNRPARRQAVTGQPERQSGAARPVAS